MNRTKYLQHLFLISCVATCWIIPGCSYLHPYRAPIQQGNILEEATVNQLHNGMSKAEVKKLLGNPVLKNTFHDDQLFYVYHFITYDGKTKEQRLILTFKNDSLVKITKS